jgi:hypothetical protein
MNDDLKDVNANELNLLRQMLEKLPKERITAQKALIHPYFKALKENPKNIECNMLY